MNPNLSLTGARGVLLSLVLISAILALLAYAHLAWQQAQNVAERTATIAVSGTGEVLAIPDIGVFSFAVIGEAETAVAAQQAAAERNNQIVAYLEDAGVAETDIKTTSYNLSPRYRFERAACPPGGFCPPGEQALVGYEVRQQIEVRVRDTAQAGEIISGVGAQGADNISNLRFTIDDDAVYVAEARAEAIQEAQARAEVLAQSLGVRLVRVVDFYEQEAGYRPPLGLGMERAVMMEADMAVAPDMPVGENEIRRTVTLTYEVR